MKFAHMADVHIGAWRDPRMKELPIEAFEKAVSMILEREVNFVLIAGDLFNTAVPPLDQVKRTVKELQRLKKASIPVYAIAGSHDYSPSGKTMLDVLEEAGLLINVMKGAVVEGRLKLNFTQDEKTGVKLTGILGRAGSLDKSYYEDLDREALEDEPNEKIFLFHASLAELKPKELQHMEAQPVSTLPKGFDYYAGGHVHIRGETSLSGYKSIVYPGPLFPASFSELEELGSGSFCMVDEWKMERIKVPIKEHVSFFIDAEKKSPEVVNQELQALEEEKVAEKIVLLRIQGELKDGRTSDIRTKELIKRWYQEGAYFVMKNTNKLSSKEFEEYQVNHSSADEVEDKIIKEHVGQHAINGITAKEEIDLTKELINTLGDEQREGEKRYEYEERVVKSARALLEK